jgi:hypothetical protein
MDGSESTREDAMSIQDVGQDYVRDAQAETAPQQPPPHPPQPYSGPPRRADWKEFVYPEDPRRKSPALAILMSLMPGLGQVYVGYYQLGFIHILVVGSIIALLSTGVLQSLEPLLGLFLAFFWLYNLVDAGRRAAFYNQALSGLSPLDVPDDMKLPSSGGSLAGGAALVLVGLIAFSHTGLGFSLRWVEQWWPMALVVLGAYLIYQSMAERNSSAK